MVVTALVPIEEIGVMHERVGWPSSSTVQAPHWATPQPYLVPFRSIASRSTQSKGMRSGTSTVRRSPLTRTVYFIFELSANRFLGSVGIVCDAGGTSRSGSRHSVRDSLTRTYGSPNCPPSPRR